MCLYISAVWTSSGAVAQGLDTWAGRFISVECGAAYSLSCALRLPGRNLNTLLPGHAFFFGLK